MFMKYNSNSQGDVVFGGAKAISEMNLNCLGFLFRILLIL